MVGMQVVITAPMQAEASGNVSIAGARNTTPAVL